MQQNADGLPLVLFAACWFSATSLLVKALGPGVPVEWVACMRSVAALPLLLAVMRLRGLRIGSPNWASLSLRGFWGVLAMALHFWALPRMPIADAMLLFSAAPIYANLWGVLFLGERPDRVSLVCLALAFAGVYVVFRPGALSFDSAPYFAALASGVFSSLAFVTIKSLTRNEPSLRIILYFSLVGTAAFLPAAWRSGYRPDSLEWLLMATLGLTATVGQLFLTAGIGRSPVSRASMGAFFIVVLNILGGWVFWGERPDAWTWLGLLLISAGITGLTGGFRRRLLVTVAQ